MLAVLSEVPVTPEDWTIWSFHHQLSHRAIIDAIFARDQIKLFDYSLDPLPPPDKLDIFLSQNQLSHQQINSILNTGAPDLSTVDLADVRQRTAWINIHYQLHLAAETALRL